MRDLAQSKSLLELKSLKVAYGGIHAVKGIDLDGCRGRAGCLIGANGAGKTTTLKAITGLQPVKGGVDPLCRREHHRQAVVRSWCARGCRWCPKAAASSVRLPSRRISRWGRTHATIKPQIRHDIERVYTLFPRLKERRRQTAGTLSGGEQQMLAMGRAMMSRPKLLLLDEPSMGLAPLMVQKVFETVIEDCQEGVTILLIEQNAKLALEVSNRGYVMESGEITLSGDAKQLLSNPKVREAYLGENSA